MSQHTQSNCHFLLDKHHVGPPQWHTSYQGSCVVQYWKKGQGKVKNYDTSLKCEECISCESEINRDLPDLFYSTSHSNNA